MYDRKGNDLTYFIILLTFLSKIILTYLKNGIFLQNNLLLTCTVSQVNLSILKITFSNKLLANLIDFGLKSNQGNYANDQNIKSKF